MRKATATYLNKLRQRAKESHVYRKYQLLGLEIAQVLQDEKHKSLYIKLAKERGGDRLMAIAKDVADRKEVRNKGAYFMSVLSSTFSEPKASVPKAKTVRAKRTIKKSLQHAE